MSGRIDCSLYWMPLEHKVCVQCCESNPYAIHLVKVGCFYPYRPDHDHDKTVMVVIDCKHVKLVPIRRLPSSHAWIKTPFKFCRKGEPGCCCGKKRCCFAHSQDERDTWNIKRRVAKGK